MFTKNPLRIVLAFIFAMWGLGAIATFNPFAWVLAALWFACACRMATHKWPTTLWREYRN